MAVVTGHAIAAQSQYDLIVPGASIRLQKAMEEAVLTANREGIANEEQNSPIIKRRMMLAHQKELRAIMVEAHVKQRQEALWALEARVSELLAQHMALVVGAEQAHVQELAALDTDIEGLA